LTTYSYWYRISHIITAFEIARRIVNQVLKEYNKEKQEEGGAL